MFSRVPLIFAPTPVHRLDKVSDDLGVDLWIKRDDLTGFALGGNKGRKLEYLMAEVLASQAQVVVACGSIQSNFLRQLGAACAKFGVRCAAVVMRNPYEDRPPIGTALPPTGGNVTLDELVGIELHRLPDGPWDYLFAQADAVAAKLRDEGLNVFQIPVGGSSPQGAYSFIQAAAELSAQTAPFDFIVHASSSGSTQIGLAHAFRGSQTRVIGIACDPEPILLDEFIDLSERLCAITGDQPMAHAEVELDFRFVGPGYGIPSEAGNDAVRYLARREGVFLDPIYTGKGFAGLRTLIEEGTVSGRVCFWHTGGIPALFA